MGIEVLLRPRPRPGVLFVAAAVMVAAGGWFAWLAYKDYSSVETIRPQIERLRAQYKPVRPVSPTAAEFETRKRWSEMQAEASFTWYPILHALEEANSQDIELLEFVPDKVG